MITVSLLAVFAALVAGVNIGKKFYPAPPDKNSQTIQKITPSPSAPKASPTPAFQLFTDSTCGVSFIYPANLSEIEIPTGGIMLTRVSNPSETVYYNCSKAIAKPDLAVNNIVNITVGTVSAKLYQDYTPAEGKPMNKLIFRHPGNKMEIQIGGLGDNFNIATTSVNIK
jgi:hypothetical protein